jgi:hypothetical protein
MQYNYVNFCRTFTMIETIIARRGFAGRESFECVVDWRTTEPGSETRVIPFKISFTVIYSSGTVQYSIHHTLRMSLSVEG